jgi:peptidoglycan hydrolase-like protein with peptidoglycan-binding domain
VTRRRALAAGALAALIVAVAALAATGSFARGEAGSAADGNSAATSLVTVTRQTLSAQTQASATLGYAGAAGIMAPSGTSPTALRQARQAVTSAAGALQAAHVALAADLRVLAGVRARLAADRQKRAVDCGGAAAAQTPQTGASGDGGAGSGACATDQATVSSDEQLVTGDAAKVASDRQSAAASQSGLAGARASLAAAESSATIYGEGSSYTSLPAVGRVLRRGQTLYRIDDRAVVLLYGPIAQWRAFVPGMSRGRDVAELNANLSALGFGRGLQGDAFSAGTAAGIRAFQSAHGLAATGRLLLGAVVFRPGPVRVTDVTPATGAAVQPGPVLRVSSTIRQVTIELNAGQQAGVKVGDPVTITLPDGLTTPGVVSSVGTVAKAPAGDSGAPGSQTPTIEVHVTPSNPSATGHLDQAPVTVSITTATAEHALVVPVDALLALAGGGYAVEEVAPGGIHHLVPVTLGLFDDAHGLVQVTATSLSTGRRIVVPST